MIAAAAATETDVTGAPEVAGGGWISGNTLTTILSILCGAGGIVGGKMWGDRSTKKREEEIRAQIVNELRAKIVNDPLHVQQQGPFVTVGECKQHRCALEKRIDALGPALNRIFKKLNANDQRSEERSVQLHRRLDPVVEKVAATAATVEMMKGQKK